VNPRVAARIKQDDTALVEHRDLGGIADAK
jgi:hypothetical protein